jgi:hypothetical protein
MEKRGEKRIYKNKYHKNEMRNEGYKHEIRRKMKGKKETLILNYCVYF